MPSFPASTPAEPRLPARSAERGAAPVAVLPTAVLPAIVATDGELLAELRRDPLDETAFGRLVERHGAMVWRVCEHLLGNRHDAEDAFQATWLVFARRGASVRTSDSAAGWLYRVAYRTALVAKRRARRRKETPLEADPALAAEEAFPDLLRRQTVSTLMQELDKLPAKHQTPLVLRYLQGKSRREIADLTDTTIATVQGRLARGKQLLRQRLVRRGVSLSTAMAIAGLTPRDAVAVPHALTAQATGDAAGLLTGSTLTASTTTLSLYREGVSAMLVSQAVKPMLIAGAGCLLALFVGFELAGVGQAQDRAEPAFTLDATSVSDSEAPSAAPVQIAAAPLSPARRRAAANELAADRLPTPLAPLAADTPPTPFAQARLAFGDDLDVAIWGGASEHAYAGGGGIDAQGNLELGAPYGRVPNVGGQTLAEAQKVVADHVRRVTHDPALRVRVLHERFGVAGGEPGEASEPPTPPESVAATAAETQTDLDLEIERNLQEAEKQLKRMRELAKQVIRIESIELTRKAEANQLPPEHFGKGLGGFGGGGGVWVFAGARLYSPLSAVVFNQHIAAATLANSAINRSTEALKSWASTQLTGIAEGPEALQEQHIAEIEQRYKALHERIADCQSRIDQARADLSKAVEKKRSSAYAIQSKAFSEKALNQADRNLLRRNASPPFPYREGMSGSEILRLQQQINRVGTSLWTDDFQPIEEDSDFGPLTRQAVERLEKHFGLPVTGAVDVQLHERLSEADGADVRWSPTDSPYEDLTR
ncbi:sigma-70 family RNA polymerase sigma factor [Botrimarina hoheduenensis]|nr:sigma-70 family RNA polymerase sigma factor [Botrimarina hoheduenensis]